MKALLVLLVAAVLLAGAVPIANLTQASDAQALGIFCDCCGYGNPGCCWFCVFELTWEGMREGGGEGWWWW